MQAILTATQGQEDFRHENGEISKVRIEAVGLGMRRVRVASLPPEVEEKTSKMALGAFGEIHDIQPEIWSNAYRYRVCSTCGKHVTGQTYPFTCGGGRVQSTNIIRGAADNLSQLQRTGSSSNCVPAQTAGESGRHTGNHGIMGGNGAEWAQFKHHILNRATDMAAPENMEAETLQEPDSAPTHQKNEIDQRGVEAIPIKEEERVLEPTSDTAGERPHVEGRRRTHSNDHAPTVLGGVREQDGYTSRAATCEAAARQEREWTAQQRQHGRGRGHFGVEYRRERRRSSSPPGTGCKRRLRQPAPKGPKH